MKRKVLQRTLVFIFIFLFTCILLISQNLRPKHYYEISVLPYVSLYNYENFSIDKQSVSYTMEELKSAILLDLSSKNIYKPDDESTSVKNGNIICADLTINSDNNCLHEDNFYYIIGSQLYGLEFDKALIGMKKKEKKEITIYFNDSENEFNQSGEYSFLLNIKDIMLPIEITDEEEIKRAYGCKSMEEVYHETKERLTNFTIVNKFVDKLIKDSVIKGIPKEGKSYISDIINGYQITAENKGLSFSEYVQAEYQITEDDFYDRLESYFCEWMILKAVTERENIRYTNIDYEEEIKAYASENGLSPDEVVASFDEVDLCYDMFYRDVESIALSRERITDE